MLSAEGMFSQGYKQNFITWKTGTVGISISGDEHLAAFLVLMFASSLFMYFALRALPGSVISNGDVLTVYRY